MPVWEFFIGKFIDVVGICVFIKRPLNCVYHFLPALQDPCPFRELYTQPFFDFLNGFLNPQQERTTRAFTDALADCAVWKVPKASF